MTPAAARRRAAGTKRVVEKLLAPDASKAARWAMSHRSTMGEQETVG